MDFYFDGHWRLDWGFGNPNMTAVLIAEIALVLHLLALCTAIPRRNAIRCSLLIIFGILLIHTYSRGGVIAAIAGQVVYWAALTKGKFAIPNRKTLWVTIGIVVGLIGYSMIPSVNASSRYVQGVLPNSEEDRSLTNRIRIWKCVPRMMRDAPSGWGLGEAGKSWTQYYQQADTRYQYRTLVSTHFTWLVEFGWLGRFLYLAGWGMVMLVFWGVAKDPATGSKSVIGAVGAGLWATLGVASVFSAVAESITLWVLPLLLLLLGLLIGRGNPRSQLGKRSLLCWVGGIIGGTTLSLAACFVIGGADRGEVRIRKEGKYVIIGQDRPRNLLAKPDTRVVGKHYGIHLRSTPSTGWIVSDEIACEFPASIRRIVLSGNLPVPITVPDFVPELVLLNPATPYENSDRQDLHVMVVLGEFRRDPVASIMRSIAGDHSNWELQNIAGHDFFLSHWAEINYDQPKKPGSESPTQPRFQ